MITSSPDAGAPAHYSARRFNWNPFEPAETEDGPALLARGPEGELRIELPLGWSTIGSSPRAEIRLEDPGVSRIHARIIRDRDETVHVIDDRSLSGVFVNGERVRCAELGDSDELEIGPYSLIVLAGAAVPHPVV